jgi:hypothetical protein
LIAADRRIKVNRAVLNAVANSNSAEGQSFDESQEGSSQGFLSD